MLGFGVGSYSEIFKEVDLIDTGGAPRGGYSNPPVLHTWASPEKRRHHLSTDGQMASGGEKEAGSPRGKNHRKSCTRTFYHYDLEVLPEV